MTWRSAPPVSYATPSGLGFVTVSGLSTRSPMVLSASTSSQVTGVSPSTYHPLLARSSAPVTVTMLAEGRLRESSTPVTRSGTSSTMTTSPSSTPSRSASCQWSAASVGPAGSRPVRAVYTSPSRSTGSAAARRLPRSTSPDSEVTVTTPPTPSTMSIPGRTASMSSVVGGRPRPGGGT